MAKKKENNQEKVNLAPAETGTEQNQPKKTRGTTRKLKETDQKQAAEVGAEGAAGNALARAEEERSVAKKPRAPRKRPESMVNLGEAAAEALEQLKQTPEAPAAEGGGSDYLTRFSDFDIHLIREGRHYGLHHKFGAHVMEHKGVTGTYFALWAPNAESVSVIGDWNGWNRESHPMGVRYDGSGIWECFIPHVGHGTAYKYYIRSHHRHYAVEKADPYAVFAETPPKTASVIWEKNYEWQDGEWMQNRKATTGKDKPVSVYEVHLGSWRRVPEEENRSLTYRELADYLVSYVKDLGYTHVEFLPVMEHPFFGSWGYQITSYFAVSSRFGTPQDFKFLIDRLHQEGIGVILDWVPSHFPEDQHGLGFFDGTHLYEHEDKRKGFHPDWKSLIFNYGRNEVKSFLISNALYWLEEFHVDGLRVDAVASMLYLDYSRNPGEWIPNAFGGRENLEAIHLLKEFNDAVTAAYPEVLTVAEESTAWPMVSQPTQIGGLGFDMKWMMGWMHDTLQYLSQEPVYRSYHQGQITFSIHYAFTEHFMLPLSHDEVVHGKGSLLRKMPGDDWQKFANLRLLFGYMFAHPGAKLMFMGGEFGQEKEWNHDSSLEWHLLYDGSYHQGLQQTVRNLNQLYRGEPALHELGFDPRGFEWVELHDATNSVISFLRKGNSEREVVLVVCNFTPVVRENYRVGVPFKGEWREIFNTDSRHFGGSGVENGIVKTFPIPYHGRSHSVSLTLPPLGVSYFKLHKTKQGLKEREQASLS
jgi:1,4-alpha-glucan branching enzyme